MVSAQTPVDPAVDLADVQGNILRGYRKPFVRHLVLTVRDASAARRWLRDATSGDDGLSPQVTDAQPWDEKPPTCLNVGITHAGLRALGLAAEALEAFPHEFVDGMASRAVKIGDTGPSSPHLWKPEWRNPEAVHLVVTVHADDARHRAETADRVLATAGGRAFSALARLDGEGFPGGLVHFGYQDNIAQPHFAGIRDPLSRPDRQPIVEVGAVLLGYANPIENVRWEVPPHVGFNSSFSAFRVLEQRVQEFEDFLTEAASTILTDPVADELLPPRAEQGWNPPMSRHEAMRELVAAKILGRWRNGLPLAISPTTPTPDPPVGDEMINDFGYADDPDGLRCPIGSHIRRCNPRDARIVQRNTNHARRIVRRGVPYGPKFDPARPDGVERGLLGAFVCASLIVQFEGIQYDWMNLGLHDPRITGSNDAVVGNNDPDHSSFSLAAASGTIELRGFPRFVHTRGGAYLFLPSITALKYLGTEKD
jgi:deferrochelatase/peroxidase EfeB